MLTLNRLLLLLFITLHLVSSAAFTAEKSTYLNTISFTQDELDWIQKHPEVLVGAGPDWAPFDFVDNNQQYTGIAHDYLSLIEEKSGLKFKYVIDNWHSHLNNIKNQRIDLIGAAYFTQERTRFVNYSQPYFEVLDYFFIRDDLKVNELNDLDGKRVAIPKGFAQISVLQQYFPKINIISVNTIGEAIDAVLENKADMLFDAYAIISHALKKEGIKTIIPFKSTRHLGTNYIHIITRKGAPELTSIIQKSLQSISKYDKQRIQDKWFGTAPKTVTQTADLNNEEIQWLKENPNIVVGGLADVLPFNFVNEHNQYQGIVNDYLTLISEKTGLNFTIKIASWDNHLKQLKQQQIDIVGGAYYTEERSQYALFSDSFFEVVDYFFIRQGVQADTLEDLNGLTVAMPKGFVHGTLLKQHFPDINILTTDSLGASIDAVLEHKADLLFNSFATLKYTLKKSGVDSIIPFKSTRQHIGTNHYRMMIRKNAPQLQSIINKGLSAINEHEKEVIFNRWLGGTSQQNQLIPLSKSEQSWLQKHKNIRYVGKPDSLPFEAFDPQKKHIGITAEHLSIIEQKLGIKLQKIPTRTWQESIEKIKAGEADILSESTSSELKSFLNFTQPYIASPIVIVMKNTNNYIENIQQISDKKIALIKDYAYADKISAQYPNIHFEYVATVQDGLTAVSIGKVDVLLATLAQSSYHISELGLNNVLIVGKTKFTAQQAFSIRSELAPLIPLFNRAIASISQNEKQAIFNHWGKSRFAVKTNYQLLFQIAAILAFIIMVFIYWNRKLAKEVELRAQLEHQTQSIIDAMPIQIIITSHNGDILSANPKALSDYSIKKEDITDLNIQQFYFDITDRKTIFDELTTQGKVEQKLVKFKRLDNELRSMMVSVMPVKYNKQQAYLSIAVDLTERLSMEKELHQAKESAEQANKAKSLFLANMSHEIRTPMNAIIGFTELLNDQINDTKLKKYTKIIQSAGNNLLTLINDILDLSKIESGRYKITKTAVNPHDLFAEIGNIFLMKIQENNIDFHINIDPKIPNSLLLDATRIRQVIFNLIGNAVKFTQNGTISVTIQAENNNDILSTVDLKIAIQDTGIGIAPDQLDTIFKEFEQAQGQDNALYGGTGLGLPISKRLIEMMDGELNVQSTAGQGSTFTILLKQVDVASVKPDEKHNNTQPDIQYDFEQAHILIVDDVADNRALIKENLLTFPKLTLSEATNGEEAIQLCHEHQFDLILMDIRMPVMDGYQATHQIRTFSDTPIIALTASVVIGEFRPLQQGDFDGYLRKPVLKKDLFNELSRHIAHTKHQQASPKKQGIHIDSIELKHLNNAIKALKNLQEQCHSVIQNNDINRIQTFANEVLSLSEHYPIHAIEDYAKRLLSTVDSFDISGIKSHLTHFATLIEQLEQIKENSPTNTK